MAYKNIFPKNLKGPELTRWIVDNAVLKYQLEEQIPYSKTALTKLKSELAEKEIQVMKLEAQKKEVEEYFKKGLQAEQGHVEISIKNTVGLNQLNKEIRMTVRNIDNEHSVSVIDLFQFPDPKNKKMLSFNDIGVEFPNESRDMFIEEIEKWVTPMDQVVNDELPFGDEPPKMDEENPIVWHAPGESLPVTPIEAVEEKADPDPIAQEAAENINTDNVGQLINKIPDLDDL